MFLIGIGLVFIYNKVFDPANTESSGQFVIYEDQTACDGNGQLFSLGSANIK